MDTITIPTDWVPWPDSVWSEICRGRCSGTWTGTVWSGAGPEIMPMATDRRQVGNANDPAPGRKWTNSWKCSSSDKIACEELEFVIQIGCTMAQEVHRKKYGLQPGFPFNSKRLLHTILYQPNLVRVLSPINTKWRDFSDTPDKDLLLRIPGWA